MSHTATGEVSMTILFLDDEEAILVSLRSLFRKEGHNLVFFTSAHEALDWLERNYVDIIFSDMRMPEMGGMEFLQKASLKAPHAIRVMLSGHEEKKIVLTTLAQDLAQHYFLKPWEDGKLKTFVKDLIAQLEDFRRQRLSNVLLSLKALPSPPRFHDRLRNVLSDDENSLNQIVEEVEKSPALVAKLIRVANSVHFASRQTIASVRDAVVFIGTDYIACLVVAIEAFELMCNGMDKGCTSIIEQLWNRSLRRATIARRVAADWDALQDQHHAYTASLLQDIGYVARLCSGRESFETFLKLQEGGGMTEDQADRHVFTIPHAEVSAALLQSWNFPQKLVNAVGRHHGPTGGDKFFQVVQIADALELGTLDFAHDPSIDTMVEEWRQKLDHIPDNVNHEP